MLTYKVVKTFTQSEAPAWDLLVQSTLGVSVNSERKKGYIFAREALRSLLHLQGRDIAVKDLVVLDHNRLKNCPEYTFSLSHTKGVGAAVLARREDHLAVGIDIELENRSVKENIVERISNSQDAKLRNIELWCVKEAVFKCLMNTGKFDRPFEFSQIIVDQNNWSHPPSSFEGEWKKEAIDGLIVVLAYL